MSIFIFQLGTPRKRSEGLWLRRVRRPRRGVPKADFGHFTFGALILLFGGRVHNGNHNAISPVNISVYAEFRTMNALLKAPFVE